MKKIFLFIIIIVLIFCGCASQYAPSKQTAKTGSNSEQAQESTNNNVSENFDEALYDLCRQMDRSLESALDMYECNVAVSQRDGKIDVTVCLEAMPNDFVFFDILTLSRIACKKYESENDFDYKSVLVYDGTSELGMLSWRGEDFDTGFFMDSKKLYSKTMTYEELIKYLDLEDIYEDLYGGENDE